MQRMAVRLGSLFRVGVTVADGSHNPLTKRSVLMNKVASVVFCLAVLCLSPSAALKGEDKKPAKVDVTGTWKVEVEVGGQTGEPVFTLQQKGDKITGKKIPKTVGNAAKLYGDRSSAGGDAPAKK
jgi:hypothetical protein